MTLLHRLPVHETFHTWQGEGCHLGRSAFFIRTQGCPVHCPWCDSAGTWHPDYVPSDIPRVAVDELTSAARQSGASFVVITGGEPTIHDLGPLCDALHQANLKVHLETCGAYPLRGEFDWITLSPKWWKLPLEENVRQANELKIIMEAPDTLDRWLDVLGSWIQCNAVWLHPEWSQHTNPAVLAAINQAVKTQGDPYRAGYQLHKLYRVDAESPGTRPPVPLGGVIPNDV